MYVRGNNYGLMAMQAYGGYGQMEPTEAIAGTLAPIDEGSYAYVGPLVGSEEEAWNVLSEDLYILEEGGWSTLDMDVVAYEDGQWQTVATVVPPTAAGPESAPTGREGPREEKVEELIERDVREGEEAVEEYRVGDIEGEKGEGPWKTLLLIGALSGALGLAGYGVYRATRRGS